MSPTFQTKVTQPAIHHTSALFQWVNPIARLNAQTRNLQNISTNEITRYVTEYLIQQLHR